MNEPSTGGISWGSPPPPAANGPRPGKWVAIFEEFRKRPGEWGRLPGTHGRNVASNVQQGMYKGVERGEFEASARKADAGAGKRKGAYHIYLRYVGGKTQ